MNDWTVEEVAAQLRRAGLEGPSFDPEAIASDLTARCASGDELDALVEGPTLAVGTAWDPRWPR